MAQLIDYTYFFGEINLPGSALSGDYADIDDFIEKYEKEALIHLLGYTHYKELKAEIDAASYSTKWSRLVNGHEYTINYLGKDQLVKWNGLINTDKDSLLAYYIYYSYVKFHVTHSSSVGEVLMKVENGDRFSISSKLVNAWNQFIMLRGMVGDQDIEPTAYNFLNEFEDDATNGYDKWMFKELERMNTMGI
jgi:hypothetical protein